MKENGKEVTPDAVPSVASAAAAAATGATTDTDRSVSGPVNLVILTDPGRDR